MSRVGIITGMKTEADILHAALHDRPSQSNPMIAVAGGSAARAEMSALEFAAAGVAGLVSFGLAGGLDPGLSPGDLIIADGVLPPGGSVLPTHTKWRAVLAATTGATGGVIFGSDAAIAEKEQKSALFGSTGARAVDMESHGVARAARDTGLPFLAVRAIADPAVRPVPPAALVGLGADGGQRPIAVLGALLRNPAQLPALIRLARDARTALRSLAAVSAAVIESKPG